VSWEWEDQESRDRITMSIHREVKEQLKVCSEVLESYFLIF